MLHIKNLKKYYEKRLVLDIEDLVLEEGKCYCILGPNGSGKSTLLRILAGVVMADEGSFDGIKKTDIGYLPQKPYIFDLSVAKNVTLGTQGNRGIWGSRRKRTESKEKMESVLEQVGLAHLAKANAKMLSGGEAQRMAFARLIVRQHTIILLDEPTSATDIIGIDAIEQSLKQYQRAYQSLVILTTHQPTQAMRLADEIIFLENGKVLEKGTADKVLNNPEHQSVKTFLKYWKM